MRDITLPPPATLVDPTTGNVNMVWYAAFKRLVDLANQQKSQIAALEARVTALGG